MPDLAATRERSRGRDGHQRAKRGTARRSRVVGPALAQLPLRVQTKRLAVFTRQLSVMLDAGLPLAQCLEILAAQEDDKRFRGIVHRVRGDVEAGASLAGAMRRSPAAFDRLYVSMVEAGEAGGVLDIILQRLAAYLEKTVRLKNQVRSALVYPVAVLAIASLVVWIILWKVVPVFAQLFAGLGSEMPYLTRLVVNASEWVGRLGLAAILLAILLYLGLRAWHRTRGGARSLDGLLLKIPILGGLLRKIAVARFCRTLSTLTASGVPILDGLQITARTAGNAVVHDAVLAVRKAVEEGRTLAAPLAQTRAFPPMVVQMIHVGEQTGALDPMLSKIADFYEDEVDTGVTGLTKLLEPLLIAFLGVVIGTIVVAMYLPMYTILSRIG
ncbi:MAG: type II secretion system F family protein [Thermoanaerobaculia bacterium]